MGTEILFKNQCKLQYIFLINSYLDNTNLVLQATKMQSGTCFICFLQHDEKKLKIHTLQLRFFYKKSPLFQFPCTHYFPIYSDKNKHSQIAHSFSFIHISYIYISNSMICLLRPILSNLSTVLLNILISSVFCINLRK